MTADLADQRVTSSAFAAELTLQDGDTRTELRRLHEVSARRDGGGAYVVWGRAEPDGGGAVEVGIVGRDGMLGLPIVLNPAALSFNRAMVQMPGIVHRMAAPKLFECLGSAPVLAGLLRRGLEVHLAQVSQTAACNGNHGLEQRLARWLLMSHDRVIGDELPMTQEFLAMMLCVHRPSVTVAARILQRANLIRYGKGSITITDRPGLEAASCEC